MKLTCKFGHAGAVAGPPPWVMAGATGLVDGYATASGGKIELQPDFAALGVPLTTKPVLGSFDLHQALRQLIGNHVPGQPVSKVGILFAGRYAYAPSIFGMMFDTGFDLDVSSEGNAPLLAGPPREGCVVFLDAIAAVRPLPGQYQGQTLFTTIHELGHVFNLQHAPNEPNFLRTSDQNSGIDPAYWHFVDQHLTQLQSAVGNPNVWPGGSPFLDIGTHDGHTDDPFRELSFRKASPLRLNVSLSRSSFYHFEAVELDVSISLDRKAKRPISIPDCLDPGYTSFRIWIEDPVGERRLYRPIRHYCWNGATREVAPRKSFLRDISIFGQSGGYTFRRAGTHSLWVEIALPKFGRLSSVPIAFEVRPIRSEQEQERQRLFSSRSSRILLYHRVDRSRSRAIKVLDAWLSINHHDEAAPEVHYALARALAERAPRKSAAKSELHRQIKRHARSALRAA